MGRYTGPVEKLSRREGVELFLKGERALNGKSALERRGDAPPGQHGQARRRKPSIYQTQLRAKQTAKRYYGIREGQFRRYVQKANRMHGVTGEELLNLLERRLDNVVYRLGFASDHAEARQLVRHGHFRVNGHKVNIPSFLCRANDAIDVKEGSKKVTRVLESLGAVDRRGVPKWLELDKDAFKGRLTSLPSREDLTLPIREQLIVELYSR